MTANRTRSNFPANLAVLLAVTALAFSQMAIAQGDEDLTDNQVCLGCHEGNVWAAPKDTTRPRIHEDSGQIIQEPHQMFACVDCHMDIIQIPHREDVAHQVECTNCHETTPQNPENQQ